MFDRHFLLPATLAAAMHGALFFGFPHHPPVPPAPKPPAEKIPTIVLSRMADDPKPLDPFAETGSKPSRESFRPVGEDLMRVAIHGDFTVPFLKTPPVDIPPGITRLIPSGFGAPGGEGDGSLLRNILRPTQLDAPPRVRAQSPPVYPFEAKHDGLTGQVIVEFVVDENGRVLEPRVVESTNRVFEETTLRAVAKWRFEPGTSHGHVVRFRMIVPVHFNLGE